MATIEINSKELLKAVQRVGACIQSPNTVPMLENIHFTGKDGKIVLKASNLEITAITTVPATIEGDALTCIPYTALVQTLKNFASAPLKLEVSDKLATLTCGTSRYELPLYDVKGYPKQVDADYQISIPLDVDDFTVAIRNAQKFTDRGDDLRGFSNIVLYGNGTKMKTAGINPYNIYETEIADTSETFKVILSNSVASYMGTVPIEDEIMNVGITSGMIYFEGTTTTVIATQQAVSPPNHEPLLDGFDKSTSVPVTMDRLDLIKYMARLGAISPKNGVMFEIKKDVATITANNTFTNQKGVEKLGCSLVKEDINIGFPPLQVKMVSEILDGETVTLNITSPKHPCFVNAPGTRMIVMPMKPF